LANTRYLETNRGGGERHLGVVWGEAAVCYCEIELSTWC